MFILVYEMKYLLLITSFFSTASWSAGYWASGTITGYHVQNGIIIVKLDNADDPKCQGYNYYGDYSISFPDPAVDPAKAMMAAHKAQALFDFYKNKESVNLYVLESTDYCAIQILSSYKQG
jgi:hypothetical protein